MQQSDQPQSPIIQQSPSRPYKPQFQRIHTGMWPAVDKKEENDVTVVPTKLLPSLTPSPINPWEQRPDDDPDTDIDFEDLDVGSISTMRLMQISSVMRAIRLPQHSPTQGINPAVVSETLQELPPVRNHYNNYPPELLGETLRMPSVATPLPEGQKKGQHKLVVRYAFGFLVGIGFLLLVSRFINIASTIVIIQRNLTTREGMLNALGAAAAFIAAFSIRGIRWGLFLRPVRRVSPFKTIRIFWIAVFMNFLLPVQGGEVIKTFVLKRTDGIPISRSLPTVAMDKTLDLMPALFLLAIVPFIPGIHMTLALWLILAFVSSVLLGVIFTVALTAWNRPKAIKFIETMLKLLPKGIGGKIKGFAFGFIDSLLDGASRPKIFIPAILLTCLALASDGLFAWMCFRVVGLTNMSYGTAIFGYTLFNMFTILPAPPGQLGSNETYGPLVFNQLLGFPKTNVLAMFIFSHPLAAVIMTTMCFICLGSLGLSFASVMKAKPGDHEGTGGPHHHQHTATKAPQSGEDKETGNIHFQQRTGSKELQYGQI